MEYQNRLPPEGINTPGRHPLKEFFRLAFFAIVALVCLGLLLNYAGGQIGGLLPFKAERWLANKIHTGMIEAGQDSPFQSDAVDTPLLEYLQALSNNVQNALGIEQPMSITLHYSQQDTVNAYATIGGHVYLFKGLLKQLPHENSLAMLMAHEYSHVQLRHTARGVGSGLAVALTTAVTTAVLPGDTSFDSAFFNLTSQLTSMHFSRDMESDADLNGLMAIEKLYGHVDGADDLFELFMRQRVEPTTDSWEGFFSTHPLDQDRIDALAETANENGFATEGRLTPLPENFDDWLRG